MRQPAIQSVRRSGVRSTKHKVYFGAAMQSPAQLKERCLALDREFERLTSVSGKVSLTAYRERFDDYVSYAAAGQLWAALAVEGLLNYYGVARLGQQYFSRHLQRLSPKRKLITLASICDGVTLGEDAELVQIVRRIFNARNELAHPTATECSLEDYVVEPNMSLEPELQAQVEDMRRFYELFSELSEEAREVI